MQILWLISDGYQLKKVHPLPGIDSALRTLYSFELKAD
jgi:hypothetical protein